MIIVADTSVVLDFLDGVIENPFTLIHPYKMILISPVVFHEVLRAYPEEFHATLLKELKHELLPAPTLDHWIEAAAILRKLYPLRTVKNIARMQNDILIALMACDIKAPVWSRDSDFELVCNHLGVDLLVQ
jgi:predicted nucleic acid-binding protein